jgi:hypothetical protein
MGQGFFHVLRIPPANFQSTSVPYSFIYRSAAGKYPTSGNFISIRILTWLEKKIKHNPLNAELNPICHLPALLGAHPILHVTWIRLTVAETLRQGFKLTTIRPYRQHEQILHISVLTGKQWTFFTNWHNWYGVTLPSHCRPPHTLSWDALTPLLKFANHPLPSYFPPPTPRSTAPEQTCRNLQSQKFGEQLPGGGGENC